MNKYSENNISGFHQVGLLQEKSLDADCIVGILSEKDTPKVHAMFVQEATHRLSNNGVIILASNSTAITRIATMVKSEKLLRIVKRQKVKGKSAIILKRRA